ncbi:tRNA nucleotidyltransferase [Methylocystis sp. S23]|jgi:tRNA nucleotidyltransferase (CCA-adding enzyme)
MALDSPPPDFGQTHPGLGLLRMAALLAEAPDQDGDADALALMSRQVAAGALADAAPRRIWAELARGLTGGAPSRMIATLRACGALFAVLPEVDLLFGVPQIAEGQNDVDLGAHLIKALDEAAASGAPLAVRFALLVMNVGKSDSPREHLPAHYRHIERGGPRVEAIAARFGVLEECRDLALLALAECERVHRVSKMRAGPVGAMLERLGAFDAPARFRSLMMVCACDFRAHEGRSGQVYPKAAMLETALAACAGVDAKADLEATRQARAEAIARAFRSERWSDELAG